MPKKANKAKRPKDKYYQLAKEQGYRARSAFKLIQLNKKYDFLAKASCIIDLCAAPGGWLQVAAKYMPSGSTIIGVDLMPIKPIRGVISHREDITTQECRTLLRRDMGSKKADVVLHDGAPNVGQNWAKDAYTQSELVLCSLKLAVEFLRPKGLFITKVFRSTDYNSLLWVFHQLFGKVEATKPHSSRNASAEIFVVCKDFKAPSKIDPKLLDPRYVFKELDDLHGSGTGVAGGGGANALPVLDKKAAQHNKRQREGYDDTLGPLLTRRMPVMTFLRSQHPVRILTDASALDFDADSAAVGVDTHRATTQEIRACCSDLKVLGKKDFKDLLRWRLVVKRNISAANVPLPGEGAKEGEDDEVGDGGAAGDDGSEGSGSGSDDEDDSDDEEDAAEMKELSAAALEELRRRKRAKKREAKLKAKAQRRQRLGMNLRAVDLIDSDNQLFNLVELQRLAKKVGEGKGGAAGGGAVPSGEDILASIREVTLDAADGNENPHAVAAALGTAVLAKARKAAKAGGKGGLGAAALAALNYQVANGGGDKRGRLGAVMEDDDEMELPEGGEEGEGAAGDDDEDDNEDDDASVVIPEESLPRKPDGSVDIVAAMQMKEKIRALTAMEEDFDRQYAQYLAKKEKKQKETEEMLEKGKGKSKGIKLTRMERLKQQALMTEQALEGAIDEQHQKYLTLLANAKAQAEEAAAQADKITQGGHEGTISGHKRKREEKDEEYDEDEEDLDDSSLDLSSDDDDEEEDDEDDDDEDDDEEDDEEDDDSDAAADEVMAGRASSSSSSSSSSAAAAGAGVAAKGKQLSASTKANRWFDNDLFSGLSSSAAAAAGSGSAAPSAAVSSKKKQPQSALLDVDKDDSDDEEEDDDKASVDSEGAPNWLKGLPRSERDKWHDKLKRQAMRKERSEARARKKDEIGGGIDTIEVVSGDRKLAAEDADAEFERIAALVAAGKPLGGNSMDSDDDDDKDARFPKARFSKPAADDSDYDSDDGRKKKRGDDQPFDHKAAAREQKKQEMIKKGMGKALLAAAAVRGGNAAAMALDGEDDADGAAGGADDGAFEVVPGRPDRDDDGYSSSGSDSDDDNDSYDPSGRKKQADDDTPDPRLMHYDEDTHAELLALGSLMKKHSSAKKLVDASYNRYSFEDKGLLPSWFEADERKHYTTQLPVTKAQVDAIRDRFRDIAARPVAKVAEARARKKMKVEKQLAKIKKKAEGLEESEEVQGRSRQRALQRLYKGAEVKRPSSVYVVSSSGGSHGTAQAKAKRKGENIRVVDPRLKKDRRADKRKEKRAHGKKGGGKKGGGIKRPAAKRSRR